VPAKLACPAHASTLAPRGLCREQMRLRPQELLGGHVLQKPVPAGWPQMAEQESVEHSAERLLRPFRAGQ